MLTRLITLYLLLVAAVCAVSGTAWGQFTSAGLQWTNGIEPGTASTCENAGHCWYVDCDAVADGNGSYASPFWGFETVGGYWLAGTFYNGSVAGGDIIYVKGTCEVTGSVDSATGPYKQLRIGQTGQGTLVAPTIIKSYLGTAQAIFDGENKNVLDAPVDVGRTENTPGQGLLRFHNTGNLGGAVRVQNIKIYRSAANGIHAMDGVGGVDTYSVTFQDCQSDETGTSGQVSLEAGQAAITYTHVVRNSVFDNVDDLSPGANGTITNNDGTISLTSGVTQGVGSTLTVRNSTFDGCPHALRGKHNGANMTLEAYSNTFNNVYSVLFGRTETNLIHHNLASNVTGAFAILDQENVQTNIDLTAYNNSVYLADKFLWTQSSWQDTGVITVYNNAVDSTTATAVPWIGISRYAGEYSALANMVFDHNYFRVNATQQATFSCIGPTTGGGACTNRNLADTKTYLSDTTSAATDPLFTDPASGDFSLTPGAASRTAGRNGSYVGGFGADVLPATDTDRNGTVDNWLPGDDADFDGEPTATDCDDHDFQIYSGVITGSGCSAGYYHTCQASGVYTSCINTTFTCHTGSGSTYYIDDATGSNDNAGSFASPWKSPAAFSYAGGGAGHHNPVAGDCFVFRAGTYDETYVYNSQDWLVYIRGVNGTVSDPVIVRNYPGESVILTSSAVSPTAIRLFYIEQGNGHIVVDGLTATGGWGGAFTASETNDIEFRNLLIHDIDGWADGNLSGISIGDGSGHLVHHNNIYNVFQKTGTINNYYNNTGLVTFNVANTRAYYNRIFQNPASSGTDNMTGARLLKHGYYNNSMEFDHNMIGDTHWSLAMGGRGLNVHHNLLKNPDYLSVQYANQGGINFIGNSILDNNTIQEIRVPTSSGITITPRLDYNINNSPAADECSSDYSMEPITITDNIVISALTTFNDEKQYVGGATYGQDELYTEFAVPAYLAADRNCYYNANTAGVFRFFATNNTAGTCSGYGVNGFSKTFAQWQAWGPDANSYEENPLVDADSIATADHCDDKGFLQLSPTPTPTPTPTPIPTFGPFVGESARSIFNARFDR